MHWSVHFEHILQFSVSSHYANFETFADGIPSPASDAMSLLICTCLKLDLDYGYEFQSNKCLSCSRVSLTSLQDLSFRDVVEYVRDHAWCRAMQFLY